MIDTIKKYKKYQEIPKNIIEKAKNKTNKSPYRQTFHIEPDSGYLNDPNGFSYYNGKYHLFYQWSPIKYIEDPKVWYQGWYHLESEDLITWKSIGESIEPDTKYDSHGPYSGSAIAIKDELVIFYTGNTRDDNWVRTPYQVIATMDEHGNIKKSEQAGFSGLIEGYTDHFRDPKIWKAQNKYYAIVGIQRNNKTGAAIVLESENIADWKVAGEVKTDYPNLGYMWECPDYFEIKESGVLIFSPQGLKPQEDKYKNIYQTGYLVGERLDLEKLQFKHKPFCELDLGFDFYATQTTLSPDGRRIMIAWMGLPEIDYPTEDYGYCGCLTLPRELSLNGDKIGQKPIKELQELRYGHINEQKRLKNNEIFKFETGSVFEIELLIDIEDSKEINLSIRADIENEEKTTLNIKSIEKEIILDREKSGKQLAAKYGTKRQIAENIDTKVKLQIFVDQSSVEIFVNDGETVASSRIFPNNNQKYLFIESKQGESSFKLDYWKLKNNG